MTGSFSNNAIAVITDITTGEVREHPVHYDVPDTDGASDYLWSEGSYSCDCNRALFFDGSRVECGDTRFIVRIFDVVTGDRLYEDADTETIQAERATMGVGAMEGETTAD